MCVYELLLLERVLDDDEERGVVYSGNMLSAQNEEGERMLFSLASVCIWAYW